MSVRNGLLALLAERPMGAYQLRQEFERRTGGTWPLNIGQAYTTLHRLVRDGLAEAAPVQGAGADEVERFRLTTEGRAELSAWWANPVQRSNPARDELAIKLALAVTTAGVDVARVIQAQRTESLRSLRDYTRLKVDAAGPEDLAWTLVLDNLVFAAEAEVRWLDHVEARMVRAAGAASPDAGAVSAFRETAGGARAGAGGSDPAVRR
jgi:DNA-binding PadR family transcriptional regulator